MNHDDTTNTTADDGDETCDQQRWIDELLQSSEAVELEAVTPEMHVAISAAISKLRRRVMIRRSLAGVAAAAATIAAIAAWSNSPLPRREGPGEGLTKPILVQTPVAPHGVEQPSPSPSLQGRGSKSPGAAFVANGDAIAVPLASEDPAVTVVQLYPTTTTERRWRRELSLYAGSSGQDGG